MAFGAGTFPGSFRSQDIVERSHTRRRGRQELGQAERKGGRRRRCTQGLEADQQEIDELVDDFAPAPLIDAPANNLETALLPSLPVIVGATGAKVKILASGKTVRIKANCR